MRSERWQVRGAVGAGDYVRERERERAIQREALSVSQPRGRWRVICMTCRESERRKKESVRVYVGLRVMTLTIYMREKGQTERRRERGEGGKEENSERERGPRAKEERSMQRQR